MADETQNKIESKQFTEKDTIEYKSRETAVSSVNLNNIQKGLLYTNEMIRDINKYKPGESEIDDNGNKLGEIFNNIDGYDFNTATGKYSHAEGSGTSASGNFSHAEGEGTTASGSWSHSEGHNTIASGNSSHAEGEKTTAPGYFSHAEGHTTIAGTYYNGFKITNIDMNNSTYTLEDDYNDIAKLAINDLISICTYDKTSEIETCTLDFAKITSIDSTNNIITVDNIKEIDISKSNILFIKEKPNIGKKSLGADYAHAEGYATEALGYCQHVQGKFNISDEESTYAHIVGNGTSDTNRSNAHTLDWNGNAWFAGDLKIGGNGYSDKDAISVKDLVSSSMVGKKTAEGGEIFNHYEDDGSHNANIATGDASHAEGYATKALGGRSHTEGLYTKTGEYAIGAHAEGWECEANNAYSHAEGENTIANSDSQHVQGKYNIEDNKSIYAHIVGNGNLTKGRSNAHTLDWDGNAWFAGDVTATVNGSEIKMSEIASSSVGKNTINGGEIFNSYNNNYAFAKYSHAEGYNNITGTKGYKIKGINIPNKQYTLESVEGLSVGDTISLNVQGSFKLYYTTITEIGVNTITVNNIYAIDVDKENYIFLLSDPKVGNINIGEGSHAEGGNNIALGNYSHAEGYGTKASGEYSHSEGTNTIASGEYSHAEGNITTASGSNSHAEGKSTNASGIFSHAEGLGTLSSGIVSHSEGRNTVASGSFSHAEGYTTKAKGDHSHAEGKDTITGIMGYQILEKNIEEKNIYIKNGNLFEVGKTIITYPDISKLTISNITHSIEDDIYGQTIITTNNTFSEDIIAVILEDSPNTGDTLLAGNYTHAEGLGTLSTASCQHVQGAYNIEDINFKYAHIVGNGTDDNKRSNAHTLDWDGNAWFAGDIKIGGTGFDDTNAVELSNIPSSTFYALSNRVINGYTHIGTITNIDISKYYFLVLYRMKNYDVTGTVTSNKRLYNYNTKYVTIPINDDSNETYSNYTTIYDEYSGTDTLYYSYGLKINSNGEIYAALQSSKLTEITTDIEIVAIKGKVIYLEDPSK